MQGFWLGKKVLVTGHTGFKGSWLCLLLQKLGAEVVGYSREAEDVRGNHYNLLNLGDKISSSYIADICDVSLLEQVIRQEKPEYIFHLAAQGYVRRSYKEPIDTYKSNVLGTLCIFEAARKSGCVKYIVNVTTDKCYENLEQDIAYKEDSQLGGHDIYSSSKACSEILTSSYKRSFCRDGALSIATVRAGNVIGGGDFSEDRIIPDIVDAISKNEKVTLRSPNAVRPWQHVLDCLWGYLLVAKNLSVSRKYESAYNFAPSTREQFTVLDVVKEFIKQIGKGSYEIDENLANLHEAKLLQLDASKAQKELNWKPLFSPKCAIKFTADWYKEFLTSANLASEKQIEEYLNLKDKSNV